MNVLILSITAGNGHHTTAKAIAAEMEKRGASVQVVDLLKNINKFLYDTVDKGYLLSTKYLSKPYGQMYSALEKNQKARKVAIGELVTELLATKFSQYFNKFFPDVVICTHVIAAVVMDEIKMNGGYNIPTFGVVTDYTFHPYWDDLHSVEYIVTGSPLMEYRVKRKRIDTRKVLPIGIPVHEKFNRSVGKADARLEIGLDSRTFTVLCMSGSMGYGDMEKTVMELDELDEDIQLICVCGNNDKAKESLDRLKLSKRAVIYGFVDNIEFLMDAADCIVTKPGGLTTTESMTKRLPMIFVNPIPGQEERNSEFLTACGAGILCTKYFSVAEAVYLLKKIPGRAEEMVAAAEKVLPGNGARDLGDFIYNMELRRWI